MKKSYLLLFIATIWSFAVTSQDHHPRNYIPPSPDASSLGLYVDANVGNYSGIADINIPLYNLKVGNVNVPLRLNYFAGGIRQHDEGGWVGINWSLNCGGVVARVKKHKNDFASSGYYRTPPHLRSCSNNIDQEPDMFYYSFGGYQGKFILDYNSSNPGYIVREVLKSNLKITMNNLGTSWTITTPDGTVYEFQKREITDEHFYTSTGDDEWENYTSAWYLTSIQTPSYELIEFLYNSSSQRVFKKRVKYSTRTFMYANPNWSFLSGCQSYQQALSSSPNYTHHNTSETTTDEVILNRINFPGGYISFTTDARIDLNTVSGNGHKLSSINIFRTVAGSNEQVNTLNFTYDYYSSGTASPDKISKRLRLLSVQESMLGLSKPAYQFFYYGNSLPDKNLQSSLNLGYVNNSRLQMLQRIVYPTGGHTIYEYENHNAVDLEGLLVTDGGARIKKISQSDGIASEINVKKFEYTGGKLMGRSTTHRSNQVGHSATLSNCPGPGQTTYVQMWYNYTFSFDCGALGELSNNHVIGYNQVTMLSGENGENGKIVYDYENAYPPVVSYPGLVPYVMPFDVSNKNGVVNIATEYKKTGSGYTHLKKTEYQYSSTEIEQVTAKRKVSSSCFSYTMTFEWLKRSKEIVTEYDINGLNPITKTLDFLYENAVHRQPTRIETTNSKGELISRRFKYAPEKSSELGGVYLTMHARNMLDPVLEEAEYNGTSLVYKKTTAYNDWFKDSKILEPEAEIYQKGNGTAYPTVRYLKYDTKGNPLQVSKGDNNTITSYAWGYNNTLPVAKVINSESAASPQSGFMSVPNEYMTASTNLMVYNGSLAVSLGFYNGPPQSPDFCIRLWYSLSGPVNYSGILCFSSSAYASQCNGYSSSINLNNLPTGNYVLSVTTNIFISPGTTPTVNYSYQGWSSSEEYFYQSFEEDASAATATPFAGRRYKLGDYTVPFTKPNGKNYVVDYRYLSGGTWTYIRKPYTNNMVLTEGDAIDEVRVYAQNAQMSTFTYKPLVGATSETDPNGITTFYEYDELGRLLLVRDTDKKIIKKFCYNYFGQTENCAVFVNTDQSGNFYSQNCGTNQTPVAYYVSIPSGMFSSTASVTAANQQAQQYGQQQANLFGTCMTLYQSDDLSGYYYSQNCNWNETPTPYYVSVPYGMFTSTFSQQDANDQAAQYAQQQANQYGGCSGSGVTLTYTNNSWSNSIMVELTDVNTYQTYTFYIWSSGTSGLLGSVPPGTYHVRLYDYNWISHNYSLCWNYGWGYDYTFYYVTIDSFCSNITID